MFLEQLVPVKTDTNEILGLLNLVEEKYKMLFSYSIIALRLSLPIPVASAKEIF